MSAGVSDVVILRNLQLNALGPSTIGVRFVSGGALYVEDLVINGFVGGAFLGYGVLATASGKLYVRNTTVRNGGGSGLGIELAPSSGSLKASIEDSRFENNLNGVDIAGGVFAVVRNTVSAGNLGFGFAAQPTSGNAELNLEDCVAMDNGNAGIYSGAISSGLSMVRVSNCVVSGNTTGLSATAMISALLTRGNNTVEGNTATNGSFTGTYAAK